MSNKTKVKGVNTPRRGTTTYFNLTLHNRDLSGDLPNKFVRILKAEPVSGGGGKGGFDYGGLGGQMGGGPGGFHPQLPTYTEHVTGVTDSNGYITFENLPVNNKSINYLYKFEVYDTSDNTGTVVWTLPFGVPDNGNMTIERPLPQLLNVDLTILDGNENPLSGVTVELLENIDYLRRGQVLRKFGTFTTDSNGMISVDGIEIPADSPELRWNISKSGYYFPSLNQNLSFNINELMISATQGGGLEYHIFTSTYHLNEILPLTLRTTAQPEESFQVGVGTSTGYIKVNYWDGTSEILGQGSAYQPNPLFNLEGSTIQINKTIDVNDTYSDRTMSIYSCDVDGNITNNILYVATLTGNFDSIDVTPCRELFELNINGTQISSLDLSNSTSLFRLRCNGTPISSLDITGLNNLWGLYCDDTNLDSSDNDSLLDSLSSRYENGPSPSPVMGADRVFNSNTGRTSASDTSYNTLLTQGWTINGETINTACDSTIANVSVNITPARPTDDIITMTLGVVGDFNLKPSYSVNDGQFTIMYSGEFWYLMGDYGSTELAIATSGNEDYPWLATWPQGYTVTKQCPTEVPTTTTTTEAPTTTTTTTTEEPTTTTTTTTIPVYNVYDFTSLASYNDEFSSQFSKYGVTNWDGTYRIVATDLNNGTQVYYIGTDGDKHLIMETGIYFTSDLSEYINIGTDSTIQTTVGTPVFDSITPFVVTTTTTTEAPTTTTTTTTPSLYWDSITLGSVDANNDLPLNIDFTEYGFDNLSNSASRRTALVIPSTGPSMGGATRVIIDGVDHALIPLSYFYNGFSTGIPSQDPSIGTFNPELLQNFVSVGRVMTTDQVKLAVIQQSGGKKITGYTYITDSLSSTIGTVQDILDIVPTTTTTTASGF